MSLKSEIERIEMAKVNIKAAIEKQGVTVPVDAKIDQFPPLITSIKTSLYWNDEVKK